ALGAEERTRAPAVPLDVVVQRRERRLSVLAFETARDEDAAVVERSHREVAADARQWRDARPRVRVRVVDLGRADEPRAVIAAGDEDASIRERGRAMTGASLEHRSARDPFSLERVINVDAIGHVPVIAGPHRSAGDDDAPAPAERCREVDAPEDLLREDTRLH